MYFLIYDPEESPRYIALLAECWNKKGTKKTHYKERIVKWDGLQLMLYFGLAIILLVVGVIDYILDSTKNYSRPYKLIWY